MLVRKGILAVVFFASLSACSSDSDDPRPSAPLTEITIACDQFAGTAKKITDAQAALYAGTGGTEAIDTLVTELTALKDGAPADVRAALADLGAAFGDAEEILEHPTPENKAKLADLSPKLSADSQTITAYITSKCS